MNDFVAENKFVVVVIVLVVIVLTLPVWAPLVSQGSTQATPNTGQSDKPKPPDIPPSLDEASLTGTVWEVEPKPGIKIKVTLNPGGQVVATTDSFLVKQYAGTDTLTGTWQVSGAKLHVATQFKGKDVATDLVIAGDKLYADGVPVPRIL
jgi:hypothetical protein